ncbi:hypothetical protein LMH87_007283 [Akanthomyces muscarius]|uniref:Uncharacterized protein n=1 Tax=Akanthomyces muscarius TaxID=2231603 RepID=A0A9W8QPX9_AKAMU|nr:hypothetical protein LMH87_007283 [Akanthomyces muscarius]KAJ4165659.1 hypothetical protein LMH87_007283 [Akanthomyces muscarius]
MLAPPRFPDDDTVEDDDDDKTTLASRFSLKRIPSVPMLPPLPSYSTFRLWNPKRASYRRERGWLDEEAVAIGGQMLVSVRQRPGSGSGWAGQHPPVLPPVGHRAMRQGLKSMAQGKQQPKQQQQQQPPAPPRHLEDVKQQPTITDYDYVYDKHDQPHQPQQQTEEELAMPAMPGAVHDGGSGATEDFVRPAAAVLARHPTRTDSELRDILRSTEQRLRDGDRSRSRSPEKRTPHGSPTKTSTPRSTPGGRGAARQGAHHNGSPVKYGGVTYSASGSGGMGAREGSAASIGSAANSLIAHATEELQLPGGMGSPSRLRGHEWLAGDDAILQLTTPQMQQQQQRDDMERALQQQYLQQQQQQQQLQNASPQRSSPQRDRSQRRRSTDSDASSSLSTLYSVGDEVDDASIQAVVEGPDDPFVDRRGIPVLAPLRRTMTVSSETLSRHVDHSAMPSVHHQSPPLRNPQRLQQGHQTHKSLDAQRFAGALQPPSQQQQQRGTEDVRPKSAMYAGYTSPLVSESSFTDMSVDSTTLSASSEDTITADDDEGFDVMAATPVRRRGSDASSSPFSEHDIVNMIIAAQSPKKSKNARALPTPPGLPTVVAPDGSIIPTALSPPPKSLARTLSLQRGTSLVRKASVTSSAYSNTNNNNNNNNDNTLTASRSGGGVGVNGLSVSNTVAELRRMNSLVSNTSNNSLTSAAASAATETPVLLPNLSDGRLPQLQSVRNAPRMGTKQYLNVGSSSASGKKSSIGKPGGPRPKKGGGHVRAHTTTTVAVAVTSSTTPERPAKDPRRSLGNVGSLVERYQKREVVVTAAEKELDNGKENAGLGISRAPSTRQAAALQESSRRRGGTPTRESSPSAPSPSRAGTGKKKNVLLKNPVVAELAAAEQRRHSKDKRGSVDSLGLYDQDGFLLPSPERELTKKLLRM